MSQITFLPEWAQCDGILMALPHADTDWQYILDETLNQYKTIIDAITGEKIHIALLCRNRTEAESLIGMEHPYVTLIEAAFNDTWTRDYGPLTVVRNDRLRALDFGFNGWGLKFAADKDNLVNKFLEEKHIIPKEAYRNERDFVLEGGSVETDGEGTILTTSQCLCSPNRNGGLSKKAATDNLERRLGAKHVLWLDYGALEGDDTDSHIDTLARMAPGNTILFTGCRNIDDPHFESLLKMRAQLSMFRDIIGNPFNLVELPLPDAIYDEEGNRLPATYANYLVVNDVLFMPNYNQPHNDKLAMQTVKIAFPNHKVVGVDCITLIKQHGSLHCATMQIPSNLFNPVVFNK